MNRAKQSVINQVAQLAHLGLSEQPNTPTDTALPIEPSVLNLLWLKAGEHE
jgi:hypothetical protein